MTLARINAEIAALLTIICTNPALSMTPARLDQLATLNGRREALTFMKSLPVEVQGRAARDAIATEPTLASRSSRATRSSRDDAGIGNDADII